MGQLVEKKVVTIKQIGDCLTKIKRAGDGAGLYIVDKELQQAVVTCSLQQLQTVVNNTVNCNLTNLIQQGIQGNQGEVIKEITACLTSRWPRWGTRRLETSSDTGLWTQADTRTQ